MDLLSALRQAEHVVDHLQDRLPVVATTRLTIEIKAR
jgi:hypothetical protein